uniref:CWF19-like protein 2 n=1 Tax=Cyclopterus lumpus TaxID=8103 RepID=A0A8C2X408_CYCLU
MSENAFNICAYFPFCYFLCVIQAKQQYEKGERKKELKRQRGEDTWMLPEINQRLQDIEEEGSVISKKKKEKKSKKKKKKAKKEKKTTAEDGCNDSSERDEWMTFDFLAMSTTSTTEKRAEKERLKEEERAKTQAIEQSDWHKLELNPYWKDGGSGLPPEKMTDTAAKKVGTVVNDAGLSWLRKSYQRMKEQAERQQRSLNDVVAERYGSLEEFQQRLADAEKAVYGQSRGEGDRRARGGWRKGENDARERWRRKDGDGAERDRWRRNERGRDSSPTDGERYNAGRGEERGGYRGGEQERGRYGDRFRERHGGRERDGEGDMDRDEGRDSERDGGGDINRDGGGGVMERDGGEDRERGGGGDRERGEGGDRERGGGRYLESDGGGDMERDGGEEEEEELPLLSEEEMNKLGAKLVKAEIMGNTVSRLCYHLSLYRAEYETPLIRALTGHTSEDREVLLFRTDHSGRAWPVNDPSGPQEPHGGRRKKKAIETHVDGERVRYFQDDDNVGLKEMVRREKMSSAQDQNALYSRMASKMMGKTDGDNYTLDDMFVSSAAQREGEGKEEDRMRSRAIGESRRLAASMEKCRQCFSSQELQKHLIVAIGSKVYLSLPAGISMTEGHCRICPLQHHCSATGLDEDVWSEIQLFRRTLVRMFESQEMDCVFMETHMNLRKRQHMALECLPLPRELGDMAPIYFKKAIIDCDEEWAMNKKVVDLSSKDIRHAVPRGLPYFAVDFGLQGGFAHVIENEQKFPHYFGKEVVGGMMDLEPRRWRKLIRENFDDQRKKVLQFAQWWKPYDCTKTEG